MQQLVFYTAGTADIPNNLPVLSIEATGYLHSFSNYINDQLL